MEIKAGRMVYLGYGKYWRSDAIVGLRPIEEERGPGRRTEVFTATLDAPIVASRSERAILREMAVASDEQFRMQEARAVLGDLVDALDDIPDVLRRVLVTEARFDVPAWIRHVRSLTRPEGTETSDEQNELFD
ncbi:MAG: hypothetical protein OEO20_12635 [Gemmatimonadota bacterium]|nr:hypothetical protein [Gemmatimonadota bacterium]MDH3366558.1 hypothetical protein [Gemmatimonadota bacterium]MDH3479141.1 hypothetical protein [Gemmatimonadota bacterium]MDH3569793.1 hypothetical protein [Gemmatimonadota bacterium]MDH5548872.1 hypothetical protein [Gemmatimonadota bacterium]